MLGVAPVAALAQTAPGAAEIAAYHGLHKAVHEGDIAGIKRLTAQASDLNLRDGNARTPVHIAAFASKPEAIKALAEAGADMNALEGGRYDAVTIAAVANDTETLSAALAAGNKPGNITSVWGGNALIAAAHEGNFEAIDLLIKAGSPLNHVNNLGWTAIIESIVLGDGGKRHQQSLRLLLDAGADKDITDPQGRSPLMLARDRGYTAMVEMLD